MSLIHHIIYTALYFVKVTFPTNYIPECTQTTHSYGIRSGNVKVTQSESESCLLVKRVNNTIYKQDITSLYTHNRQHNVHNMQQKEKGQ